MKLSRKLFILPISIILFTGCVKFNLSDNINNKNNQSQTNNNIQTGDEFINPDNNTHISNPNENITLQTLYSICKKATVTIEVYIDNQASGGGSGFIAKESENYLYIYTNAHVVDSYSSNAEYEVILSDYSRYRAYLVGKDTNEDVAVLKISKPSTNNYLVASLADSSKVTVGENVFAIGTPLSLDYSFSITSGIISGVNIPKQEEENSPTLYMLQTDAALNSGNSGGPLFNYRGEVIGINTLKVFQSISGVAVDGMGFSIPINHFNLVAETLLNNQTYSRPLIGISVISIESMSLSKRSEYNITLQHGVYISEVSNQNSGLVSGKVITHINDKFIYNLAEFSVELYKYKRGDIIEITYCDINGNNVTKRNITLI